MTNWLKLVYLRQVQKLVLCITKTIIKMFLKIKLFWKQFNNKNVYIVLQLLHNFFLFSKRIKKFKPVIVAFIVFLYPTISHGFPFLMVPLSRRPVTTVPRPERKIYGVNTELYHSHCNNYRYNASKISNERINFIFLVLISNWII